jgi:hypothetical protein
VLTRSGGGDRGVVDAGDHGVIGAGATRWTIAAAPPCQRAGEPGEGDRDEPQLGQ